MVAEGAEAGGHAVDGLLGVLHLLVEVVAALLDALDGIGTEFQLVTLGEYFVNLFEGQFLG